MESHLHELESRKFAKFEKEAGFGFLQSRRAQYDAHSAIPYYSYETYRMLPRPTIARAWQLLRLFLYCELRFLETFIYWQWTHCQSCWGGQVSRVLVSKCSLDHEICTIIPLPFIIPAE